MKKAVINKYLRRLGLELHGVSYIQSLKKTDFRENAFEVQQRLAKSTPKIIFDLGANRGDTALNYAKLFPLASIYAFEPFPETYDKLIARVGGNKMIKPQPVAISEKKGEAVFHSNVNEDTNSLLPSAKIGLSSDDQVRTQSQIKVNTETIDDFCIEHQIGKIDILKMDIQGAELSALKGASQLLKEKKISMIYFETYFQKQYENQPLFYEIATFLEGYGYHLQDLYSPIYGNGSLIWCDVIFLPE
jgi:FkbM family methyltransferase